MRRHWFRRCQFLSLSVKPVQRHCDSANSLCSGILPKISLGAVPMRFLRRRRENIDRYRPSWSNILLHLRFLSCFGKVFSYWLNCRLHWSSASVAFSGRCLPNRVGGNHRCCVIVVWFRSAANEYIRLVGFGNAIGHLVHLNLPGFRAVKQQSVNIDELMKNYKQPKASGEPPQIEEASGKNVVEHDLESIL